uniref:NADH-ubiquinone oxidoreductase chain 5 n=1 Tax=Nectoneanthes multignatha TaxID=3070695 RepID=A0AA50ICZ1_9ANNE|nr:NADH dehydrogenase subunit 5 [Nectoneanthes multignatha]WLW41622.1 NADH dehydrogenase subunit 5 [Nectoneanthes multignatha]
MVYITTQILMMTTLLSYIMTSIITFNNYTFIMEWVLMEFSNTKIILPIMLDPTSTIFMSTVLTIASSVMQFTKTYMAADKNKDRFVILVLLFVMSMMFLILFPHTMILLLGWDGLGITSFVLVIYYNNPKSLGAGMITALTNRIGDVMLLISIALLFNQGQWTIMNVWTQEVISWVPILILVAAMTKSAQMPFSSWLPAAMAAPTPVSALVHSSTLVTAGVFLLIRFYPMMNFEIMKTTLTMIATMTMLMASASAMAECDMKKIIALSTLSQVALMMYTLGIGMPEIAFFHLITHALFKALLFICAGNLIDIHHHSQDLRAMGNISYQLPVISSSITIANMALCGFPFLAGFYSKDLIIETSSMIMTNTNMIIMLMFIVSTVLTTAYTTRFMMFTLFMPTYSPSAQYSSEDYTQITSVLILTLMAIMGGAVTNWLMMSPSVEPNFFSSMKILAPLMVMLGLMTGIMATNNKNPMPQFIINMKCFMWFLTPMSTHLSPNMLMKLPLLELKEVDQGWSIIPYTLLNNMKTHSSMLMYSQNNSIITHMTCTTIVIMWILLSS